MPMFQLPEPAAMGETLREVPDGAGEDELAVLPVHALPLAASTQVVVGADAALVAGPHHRPIATIAYHIGMYHGTRPILSTRWAVVPPALLLLCREGRTVRWDATKFPPYYYCRAVTLSVNRPLGPLFRH